MNVETLSALRLNVPEWFARADFQTWLNSPTGRHATWHEPGTVPGEYADTFITFDNGDGSDFDALFPADLYEAICKLCQDRGLSYCVLWLTNVE